MAPLRSTPAAAGGSAPIRILGDLELPHPITAGHGQDFVDYFYKLLPDIQALNGRNLRELTDVIDMAKEFEDFKIAEEAAWNASGSTIEARSTLVRPSGSLDCPIAHRLNQPSFSTTFKDADEVADRSNGCIAMVMGNGASDPKTLITDHILRRAIVSNGIEAFPSEVTHHHERLNNRISGSCCAMAELYYGKKVHDRVLFVEKPSLLPLWGKYEGVLLGFLHESSFHNADERYLFRKAVLFPAHPQHLMMEARGSKTSVLQDLILEVASLIAGVKGQFDARYYQDRKWRSKIPSAKELGLRKAEEERIAHAHPLVKSEEACEALEPSDSPKDSDLIGWDFKFLEIPHSNQKSLELLPDALAKVDASISLEPDAWSHSSQFPEEVRDWFVGQKRVIFYSKTIVTPEDVACVLDSAAAGNPNVHGICIDYAKRHDMRYTLRGLMRLQQHRLESMPKRNQDLLFYRIDGSTVSTICLCGSLQVLDEQPQFICLTDNGYVMTRSKVCRSADCSKITHGPLMRPIDESLWAVENIGKALSTRRLGEPKKIEAMYKPLLRQDNDLPSTLAIVACWCLYCKEETKLSVRNTSEHGTQFIDRDPQWTLGMSRPLYVPRHAVCRNCTDERGQMVPVDSNIRFITPKGLRNYWKAFKIYDHLVNAIVLDSWPSSSTEPRKFKKKRQNTSEPDPEDIDEDEKPPPPKKAKTKTLLNWFTPTTTS